MIKNSKGITLTSLVIMIIILLILASIATYSGVSTVRYIKFMRAKSQMETMQAQVNSWYQQFNNGNTEIANYGEDIVSSNYNDTFLAANVADRSGYRLFTKSYIESLGIDGISYDYLINIQEREIILAEGITYQDVTYYTPEDFGISIVESVPISSISFELSYEEGVHDSQNIFLYDIKLLDANGQSASLSKFTAQYKKSSDENWMDITNIKKVEYNGDDNAYEIEISEASSYDVKVSSVDGNISKENTINVLPGWKEAKSNNEKNDWYAYTDISTNRIVEVNEPKLADGMTPVKYTESTTGSKWANAMTKDESMWVWIPRFAYRITSGYHQSGTDINPSDGTLGAGTIEIAFLDGTTNNFLDNSVTGTVVSGDEVTEATYTDSTKWILAPGFTLGDEPLTGFWFAKFEASNTAGYGDSSDTADNVNLTLQIKPNVKSWRSITSANIFTVCKNLTNSTNYQTYFNDVSNVDTHMTKNVEWGAVAYLAHSKYGLNGKKICINNNSGFITGIGSGSTNANSTSSTENQYNTPIGVTASTTKNIYGIYDMSGGAYEYVAACLSGHTSKLTSQTDTDFINKYIDIYNSYSLTKYGDAVYETSGSSNNVDSWFNNCSGFVYSERSIFDRGGYYGNGPSAGLFYFGTNTGDNSINDINFHGFRPVCVVK